MKNIPLICWKRRVLFLFMTFSFFVNVSAQSTWAELEWDVFDKETSGKWEDMYEELALLAENPLNINTATKEQLEQIPFLSDKQIESILYYLYKYGPMNSLNELIGVEGLDWQTRMYLKDFVYAGAVEGKEKSVKLRDVLKYNKQELIIRTNIPLNEKAGYASYSKDVLEKNPNKKYNGSPLYSNMRYYFRYKENVYFGFTAEKDPGEPFFKGINKKGYDFYSVYLFFRNMGRWKALALGNYKVSFGYGLILNMGFNMGKAGNLMALSKKGNGITKHSSVNEYNYLQGLAGTYSINNRWELSAFYSFRKMDARVEDMFIKSLKTDGYHRLQKDIEKKNKTCNHLMGCNLNYNGKYAEIGLTVVYNIFDKVLNPDSHPYNVYYPRGRYFYNMGGYYKCFLRDFIISGEVAFDKKGSFSTLNMLTYSPNAETTLLFMNRYFDKRYEALFANAFGKNSSVRNELGFYFGLETVLFKRFKLFCSGDFFYFPYRLFQADKNKTAGFESIIQLSYSHPNSLMMLIKYSCKDKAKNYKEYTGEKYVLPYIRQRLKYSLSYQINKQMLLKTTSEYVRTCYWKKAHANGYSVNCTLKSLFSHFPLNGSISGCWFFTDNYDSRIYMYEPGLLYSFSNYSFFGKGFRCAINLQYNYKKRFSFQAKYGWTHYTDRNKIGSGTEEIQGNNKADLQFQMRFKW